MICIYKRWTGAEAQLVCAFLASVRPSFSPQHQNNNKKISIKGWLGPGKMAQWWLATQWWGLQFVASNKQQAWCGLLCL